MSSVILDSDAFLCVRKLSILETICRTGGRRYVLMEYAARHELNSVSSQIDDLVARSGFTLARVVVRTEAYTAFRDLQRGGVDKGEAEAIAWAMHHDPTAIFVSNDVAARRLAHARKLRAEDVLGLAVLLVQDGAAEDEVLNKLRVWEDPGQQLCKPRGFVSLEIAWRERR